MKQFMRVLVVLVTVVGSSAGFAFGMERFVEGVHYQRAANGVATPGNVTEFFSFGCPHCAHLEPAVEQWLQRKPASATFLRIPATWNPRFDFLGRVYYTLDQLKLADSSMQAVFDHIHKHHKPLETDADVAALVGGLGVDKAGFEAAWNSTEVRERVKATMPLLQRYKVSGVPSFVVGGLYVTSLSMAGSEAELFEVIEFLLTK